MIGKILERLEEERKTAYRTHERFEQKVDLGRVFGLEKAIDIVQEVAKEYGKDTNVRSKDELIIHVMHGYDSLKAPNGVDCFGCYINGDYESYVADNIPTDQLFHTIAHEYMHYLQDIEGREPNEEEANAFAFSVFTPCYQQGKTDLIESAIARFEEEKQREKPLSVPNMLWDRAIGILKELEIEQKGE